MSNEGYPHRPKTPTIIERLRQQAMAGGRLEFRQEDALMVLGYVAVIEAQAHDWRASAEMHRQRASEIEISANVQIAELRKRLDTDIARVLGKTDDGTIRG